MGDWIKVSTRLPERCAHVLFIAQVFGGPCLGVGYRDDHLSYPWVEFGGDNYLDDDILYWMPAPELPQEVLK